MGVITAFISSLGQIIEVVMEPGWKTISLDLLEIDSNKLKYLENRVSWRDPNTVITSRRNQGFGNLGSIVCAGLVMSSPLFIKFPFFVARAQIQSFRITQRALCHIMLFAYFNGQICQVHSFSLPPWDADDHSFTLCNFQLFDGPTILMYDYPPTNVFIASIDINKPVFKRIDLSLAFDKRARKNLNAPRMKSFAAHPDGQSLCAIIEVKDEKKPMCGFLVIPFNDSSPKVPADVLSCAPPKLYWPLITSFCIFKMDDMENQNDSSTNQSQKKIYAVATEKRQFLLFDGSDTLLCCSIPYCDCCQITLVKLPDKETAFLLKSKENDYSLLSWKRESVVHTWNDVHSALIGDFLKVGHNQVLILFNPPYTIECRIAEKVEFFLTDLSCCQRDTRSSLERENNQNEAAKKSISLVVDALSTNIQSLKTEINQKSMLIQKKNTLIRECWESLDNMLINNGSHQDEDSSDGLVPLFESGAKQFDSPIFDAPKLSRPFQALDIKQATISEKWVVIVKLKNLSTRPISNVSLSILADNLSGETTIVSLPNQPQMDRLDEQNHISKKKRLETDSSLNRESQNDPEITLSAKTNIPGFFNEKQVKAQLMVSWEEQVDRRQKPRLLSYIIGSVELNAVDVIKGTYATKDRMFYELACVKTEFRITSKDCNLSSLEGLLRRELKNNNWSVMIIDRENPFDYKNTSLAGQASEINLSLSKSNMSVEVKIFSRSHREANQLRHLITSLVPEDSEFTFPLDTLEKLTQLLSQSLSREIVIIQRFADGGLASLRNSTVASDGECDRHNAEDSLMEEMSDQLQGERKEPGSSNAVLTEKKVEQIRCEFRKKRKRSDALAKELTTTVDPVIFHDYMTAVQESDEIAAFLFSFQGTDFTGSPEKPYIRE